MGTAQHNGQWPAKVLINILCPVHTHTLTHPQSCSHIPEQAVALLMFYESRFVCKFVGPQTPKSCNNIWQMFRFSPPSPSSLFTALSNCANSPNSWVLCAFLCYYYAMLSCASLSHSPRRKLPVFNLANARSLASRSWSRSSESKIYPNYPLAMPFLPAILSFVQFPSLLAIFPSANQLC